jgi:hypothetical protein
MKAGATAPFDLLSPFVFSASAPIVHDVIADPVAMTFSAG